MELVLTGDQNMPAGSISNLGPIRDVCVRTRSHHELALPLAHKEISGQARTVDMQDRHSPDLQAEAGHPAASKEGVERMR